MKIVTVGSNPQNSIVINDDPLVSNFHLKIVMDDYGKFYLVDFGSKGGTFVNGKKVSRDVRLNRDDVIRAGKTFLPWKTYFPERPVMTAITAKPTNAAIVCAICSIALTIAFFLPWFDTDISGAEIPLNMNRSYRAVISSSQVETAVTMITFASYLLYLIPVFAVINFLSYLEIFNSRCKYTEFVTALLGCIGLVILILVDTKIPFEDLFKILAPGFYITLGVSILSLIASVNNSE